MMRHIALTLALAAVLVPADLAHARGGRGGGGGGGRGGGAGMSRGGGGMSRAPSMSRAAPRPSMSRPSAPRPSASRPSASRPSASRPSVSRPSASRPGGSRVAGGTRPQYGGGVANRAGGAGAAARPGIGGGARAGTGAIASGRGAFESRQSFQRPSQGQLNDFLGMPAQSAGTRGAPSTLPAGDGSRSFTTQGGSTITVGGGSGSRQTAGGATIGGAGVGIKVEGAGGNTFVKGKGGVGVSGDAGSAIAAGSATGIRGAGGNTVGNVRGGYADTAGNRAIGGATGIQTRSGYTAVNARGAAVSGGVGRAGSRSAIRGPAGNVVAGGRGAAFVNGQFVGGRTWGAVNGNFTHWGAFGPGWYAGYPGAWFPGKWALASTAWATATWWLAGSYCGCSDDGVYYDYGDTVYSDGETVYYEDQPIATNEAYYDEAIQIADAGVTPTNEDWLPLGVFGVVTEKQTQADKLLQLAVNKEGQIRGNYQDLVTNQVTPVIGAVDKQSQRVVIKLEGNDSVVLETGLYNLTNDEAPALLYLGKDNPQTRTLVRLKQPEDQTAPAPQQ